MSQRKGSSVGAHRWAFIRIGGVDQVLLRNGKDIEQIPALDQKLWAALAMPKKAAGVLPATLDALDSDGDKRIRVPDIIDAVQFCSGALVDLDDLLKPGESLDIARIKPGPLAGAATWVLDAQGKSGAGVVSLSDAQSGLGKLAGSRINGDGVVPTTSAKDEGVAGLIADIVASGRGAPDLSGAMGVAAAGLDAFLAEARAWLEWSRLTTADATILVLGKATEAAWNAVESVRAKLDDFFLRSRLAVISGSKGGAAWGQEGRLASLLAAGIRGDSPDLLELPLAAPSEEGRIDPLGAVNPAWAERMRTFAACAAPLVEIAANGLDAARWERIKSALAPYGGWLAARPAGKVGQLGEVRLRAIVEGDEVARLRALIAEEEGCAGRGKHLADLCRLLLLRRDLLRVLRNFVNFADFYSGQDAVFRAGTLYLDGRACDLCLEVDNPAAHAVLAAMSGAYLVYCDCSRKDGARKGIVAALTAGDGDDLFVGRNGVLYDREGRDWDARISKILVQPISIREAFLSPYKWLARTVEELVAKRAAAAESGSQAKLKSQAEAAVATIAEGGPAKAEQKPELGKKIDVGTVAAIGVALGSIGAMVTGVLSTFLGMGAWMPVGLLAVVLLISGPSMLLAYLKLRRRNLGPILNAEGWAINGRLKINVPFGNTLTRVAALPPGSERRLQDPFAQKKRPWGLYLALLILVAIVVLWVTGAVDNLLPEAIRLKTLLPEAG